MPSVTFRLESPDISIKCAEDLEKLNSLILKVSKISKKTAEYLYSIKEIESGQSDNYVIRFWNNEDYEEDCLGENIVNEERLLYSFKQYQNRVVRFNESTPKLCHCRIYILLDVDFKD